MNLSQMLEAYRKGERELPTHAELLAIDRSFKPTPEDVYAWAERHGLTGPASMLQAAFEDAASPRESVAPSRPIPGEVLDALPFVVTGKELYMSRFEHQGAVWESNTAQGVYESWAARLRARLIAAGAIC